MFVKITISALALALTLTGCTNPVLSAKLSNATAEMLTSPLEGYELTSTVEPVCGFDYCEPNYTYQLTSSSDTDDRTAFCKKMIDWATKFGGDSWFFDPEFIALPIEGHEDAALFACFGVDGFNIVGTSKGVRWQLNGSPGQLQLSTVMNREGNLDDSRLAFHTWDEGKSLLFDGTRLNMDLLSAIEKYRTANPKADPVSESTIKAALKDITLPEGIKFVKDKNGDVHYIDLPADDVLLQRCLNIKPFDETYFKMPKPKDGFTTFYIMEGEPVDQFAYVTADACK